MNLLLFFVTVTIGVGLKRATLRKQDLTRLGDSLSAECLVLEPQHEIIK